MIGSLDNDKREETFIRNNESEKPIRFTSGYDLVTMLMAIMATLTSRRATTALALHT